MKKHVRTRGRKWAYLLGSRWARFGRKAVAALDRSSLGDKKGRDYNLILGQNIENWLHEDDFLYEDVPFFTNPRLAIQKGTFVFSLNLSRSFQDLLIQTEMCSSN
jgi:hypothetical protein